MRTDKDVDRYIARQSKEAQSHLKKLRSVIAKAAPRAEERIAYGIPAYDLAGRPLVYLGGFAKHVSLFALPSGTAAFRKELAKYRTSKGTVQFPLDAPLPLALIAKIVKFRVCENLSKKQ
jgi:uncharacterized protein YdhG (YjbR/CyaY superfamily)